MRAHQALHPIATLCRVLGVSASGYYAWVVNFNLHGDMSMKMFNGGEVATMLLVFIALVALADRASAYFRRALQ